jgi:hypothetical protein
MLKNVSSDAVELRWGGEIITLLPGQTCRYKDAKVELRQKAKHIKELEHIPEPELAAESKSQVTVNPLQGTPPINAPTDAPTVDPLTCTSCTFVAKTAAGLESHARSKHTT